MPVIMSCMADNTGRPRSERQRLKTLAQAALNADVTVGQLEAVLAELGTSLSGLNNSLGAFESSLEHLNDTLGTLDELAPRLTGVVDRMEATVGRIERIVDIVETAVSPWSATENAVRGVVNAVKDRTRR
jgi:ABC-type transporter Mla subunit MlaD